MAWFRRAMAAEEIRLVRSSWAAVHPTAPTAAAAFYDRLFELDPTVRALFRRDMAEQGRMLVAMLHLVVSRLDDLGSLLPAVRTLGARHAAYGVRDEHYDTVGEALLWTLEQGLGDAFSPEVRSAWAAAYGVLARTMQAAGRLAAAPQAA